MVVVLIEKHR